MVRALAEESAAIALSYFASDRMETRAKGDRDVVTAADLASESFLLERISREFPDDGVVGEEGSKVEGTSGRVWYLDPVDGTLNFSRGVPIWCVSVAVYDEDRPVLGAVVDPIRKETFSAASGQGAYCNGQRLSCSGITEPARAFVHVTADMKDEGSERGLEDMRILSPRVLRTRNIGSAALALAYVAAGRFDAMVHRFAYAWDYAAGVLLIEESGGTVTNFAGSRYTPAVHDVCAANMLLREEILGLLASGDS